MYCNHFHHHCPLSFPSHSTNPFFSSRPLLASHLSLLLFFPPFISLFIHSLLPSFVPSFLFLFCRSHAGSIPVVCSLWQRLCYNQKAASHHIPNVLQLPQSFYSSSMMLPCPWRSLHRCLTLDWALSTYSQYCDQL